MLTPSGCKDTTNLEKTVKNTNCRLLLALLVLLVTLGALTSAFAQITPSQDSYTNTAATTTNYGTAATLGVVSSATSIQTTYIQFNLSSIPVGYTSTNVVKATLKLYISSVATAGSFNLDFVNGSWSEKTITAGLSPALGSSIASSISLTTANANNYVLIDVTTAVGDWLNGSQANDGIALVANSPLSATIDSKENSAQSHPAELDIVFAAGGTITGVTTASGSGLSGGGTTGTLNLSLLKTCSSSQILQWSGSAWACASPGTGTISGVTAGTDLTGGGVGGNVTLNLDTTKVPQLNATNSFTAFQSFGGNGLAMLVGDPGCGAGFAGFGFGGLNGCTNYAMIGDGTNTYLNRPKGGTMHFRENNGDEMSIAPGGEVTVTMSTNAAYGPALIVQSNSEGNGAIQAFGGGGATEMTSGGNAIWAVGGSETNTDSMFGGDGVDAFAGQAYQGGVGIYAQGGVSSWVGGGDALDAWAGNGNGANGYSGFFQNGDVIVEGNLSVNGAIVGATKNFRIDHPLDPANKYLYHASVESSEMMNIYTGNVVLDGGGSATVVLPGWFEAVNADFRYQLTAIGAAAPGLHVAEEVANNHFSVAGGAPGMKVSWQVTAVRHDAYAKAHPMVVEQEKTDKERGFYVHPDLYGQPAEKEIEWGRNPAKMRHLKELHDHVLHQTAKK
jgi:hypothetical protein